jgi:hypothetical protein
MVRPIMQQIMTAIGDKVANRFLQFAQRWLAQLHQRPKLGTDVLRQQAIGLARLGLREFPAEENRPGAGTNIGTEAANGVGRQRRSIPHIG